MRSVCVKPSCCAAASVRSQRASEPNGPRSTTGSDERPRPVAHGHVRPAREAAVGDADELGRELDPARGRVAVEAGAVPGGDGAAVDGERQLGRDGGARRLAADDGAELELPGLARAPAGDERAVGLDGRARLLRPRRGGGVEVLRRPRCGRRGAPRRRRGSAPCGRAARCRRRRGRTARAARPRARSAPPERRLRAGGRGSDRGERGNEQHDAGQRASHQLSPVPTR